MSHLKTLPILILLVALIFSSTSYAQPIVYNNYNSLPLEDVWVIGGYKTGLTVEYQSGISTEEYLWYQQYIGSLPSVAQDDEPNIISFDFPENIIFFVTIGLYDKANNGVMVTAPEVPTGSDWNGYFGTNDSSEFSEASISQHLQTIDDGRPYFLEDFVATYHYDNHDLIGLDVGDSGYLVNFSNATLGGSVTYVEGLSSPVPEPSTILLLGSGLAGLACYRRKRK